MTKLTLRSAAIFGLLGAALSVGPCAAQSASVANGHRLAQALCARCHIIVRSGSASWTDAPSFESIANRPNVTRDWLASFTQRPHMDMLTRDYTPAQSNDIAAYILSLRHK